MNESIHIKSYAFKRNLKDIIPPLNYLTHNLYSYPAKFIPHVPYYVISKFLKSVNGVVLDPFAGSGSTAIEALHLGQNSICIDINPLTDFLTKVKTQRLTFDLLYPTSIRLDTFLEELSSRSTKPQTNSIVLTDLIKELRRTDEYFHPRWKNIDHWYPEEFKHIIAHIWGFIYSVEDKYPETFMNLLKLTAIFLSRYLSYGARDVPKLFRSKRRVIQVEQLRKKIKANPDIPYITFYDTCLKNYGQMKQLTDLLKKKNISPDYESRLTSENYQSNEEDTKKIVCMGDTDILSYKFPFEEEFIDLIITSPPYIYAQEYIRSTKLDLYWMDLVDDLKVRELTKKELGNKKEINIDTIKDELRTNASFNSIAKVLEKTESKKYGEKGKYTLLTYNYFYDMYRIIKKLNRHLKKNGIFGIFIGNPTVLGHQVPCHKIFSEFFLDLGLTIIEYGYDEIVSPRLLRGRQNLSPNGMKSEWLIIAQK